MNKSDDDDDGGFFCDDIDWPTFYDNCFDGGWTTFADACDWCGFCHETEADGGTGVVDPGDTYPGIELPVNSFEI